MEAQNIISENLGPEAIPNSNQQFIISPERLVFLSIATFGLYNIWWIYKVWHYYKQAENSNIIPARRALFWPFFLYGLIKRIHHSAKEKGYEKSYSSEILFIGFLLMSFLACLPYPLSLVSVFSVLFLIPSFKAVNYIWENSTEFEAVKSDTFNGRQVLLIVIGCLIWFMILISLNGSFNVSLRTD